MEKIWYYLNWVMSIIFFELGIFFLFILFSLGSSLIIVSLIINPNIRDYIYKKKNIRIHTVWKYIICIAIVVVFVFTETQLKNILANNKFTKNRESIILNIKELIKKNNYTEAFQLSESYIRYDSTQFKLLQDEALLKKLQFDLKNSLPLYLIRMEKIYSKLKVLDPHNKEYSKKIEFYKKKAELIEKESHSL